MKKVFQKLIVITLALSVFFSVAGCKFNELERLKGGLTNYKINGVYDDENKILRGEIEIDYINNEDVSLSEVCFHLYARAYRENSNFRPVNPGEIGDAYPAGMSYGDIALNALTVNGKESEIQLTGKDSDILSVAMEKPLDPTQRVKVKMGYELKLANIRHRLGYYNKTVNFGNFYPVACVYENGAFETSPYYANGDPFYTEIANYEVSVTAPSKFKGAFTGKGGVTKLNEAQNQYDYSAVAVRDFAFVLGEFETVNTQFKGIDITYFYYDDDNPADALKTAKDSIATFNNLIGEYPYDTFNVVKTAFLQGGMEYPNLVYISDEVKGNLYNEVIIHETAHQWWYGVVGNNQIDYAYLDEGLTEYTTSLFYELNPDYNVKYSDRMRDAMSAFVLFCDKFKEGGKGDTSMNRRVNEYTPIEYSFINYVKGSLMMQSLRNTIGDKKFKAGLKNYYAANKFKIATPVHLIAGFEKAAKVNLSGFFNAWIEGKVQLLAG